MSLQRIFARGQSYKEKEASQDCKKEDITIRFFRSIAKPIIRTIYPIKFITPNRITWFSFLLSLIGALALILADDNKNLGDLYTDVMELSKELKIHDHFMGQSGDRMAFVGHGVGLELDELPVFYPKGPNLVTGNVLACEPKFFFQGKKVLGIEDTYAITESSNKLLSKSPDSFEISR